MSNNEIVSCTVASYVCYIIIIQYDNNLLPVYPSVKIDHT